MSSLDQCTGSLIATQADAIIFGEAVNDDFGVAVGGGKDINGDGVPMLSLGRQLFATAGAGKAYVFYGPFSGNIQAANADAILTGEMNEILFSGHSVGDLNGDGISDVPVGAPDNGAGSVRSGRVYNFFGPLSEPSPQRMLDSIVTGSNQDNSGMSVAGGDVNGDGAADRAGGRTAIRQRTHGYAAIYLGTGRRIRNQAYPYPKRRSDRHPTKRRAASVFG